MKGSENIFASFIIDVILATLFFVSQSLFDA